MCDAAESDPDLTALMARLGEGDPDAANILMPRIYSDLRAIAAAHFRRLRGGETLQPTALVNEAFLKFAEASNVEVRDRKHFFALAARIMRQILVDHARARGARKRGGAIDGEGPARRVALEGIGTPDPRGHHGNGLDVLALEEALNRLAAISADRARLVELRFFGGLTSEEAAEVMGISRAEAARRWRAARAWLALELRKGE